MLAIGADRGRVQVAVTIDLGAADEPRLHIAALEQAHEVERARAPDRAVDVRRIPHRVQKLGRRLVTHHAELEEADGRWRVRTVRHDERDERQTHPHEDVLAVADLARGLRDHDLARRDVGHIGSNICRLTARSAFQRGPSLRRYDARSVTPVTHSAIQTSNPSGVRVAVWYSRKNS